MEYSDIIFKGATRPAMMAGVPIVPFILVVGLFLLLAMWALVLAGAFAAFVLLACGALAVLAMRFVSANDEQRLNQYLLRMKSLAGRRNAGYWGAHSMGPLERRRGRP